MILLKGVGTRIRTLTLSVALGETLLVWPKDRHCPVDVACVFPQGIPGITITPMSGSSYTHRRLQYPRLPLVNCREAWDLVWSSFDSSRLVHYPCGIQFRGFHPQAKPWDTFSDEVKRFADSSEGQVMVLADSMREEIHGILGDRMVLPSADPLTSDLDRQPDQVLAYLLDWRQFVLTPFAISNHPRSAAVWARRFFT